MKAKLVRESLLNELDDFNSKLKNILPSLTKDYANQGNMADIEDYIKVDYASFGQEWAQPFLREIIEDLKKSNIDLNDVKIGTIVDDTWGWDIKDLDTELSAGTLWVKTDDDQLMRKLKIKYKPDEFDKLNDKYRLWWD